MALDYLQIFPDIELLLSPYDDAQRGRLLMAMMAYAYRGEEPDFEGPERFIWPALRRDIDRCAAVVESKRQNASKTKRTQADASEAEQNQAKSSENKRAQADGSENKRTGAKASEAERNQADASEPEQNPHTQEQDQEHEYEHDQRESGKGARAARFTPPTQEEVTAYFREKGGNDDQALRFVSHYASNGWKVGRNPMKDWHAAVTGWIARDKDAPIGRFPQANSPPLGGQMQRYTPEQRRQTVSAAIVDLDAE